MHVCLGLAWIWGSAVASDTVLVAGYDLHVFCCLALLRLIVQHIVVRSIACIAHV